MVGTVGKYHKEAFARLSFAVLDLPTLDDYPKSVDEYRKMLENIDQSEVDNAVDAMLEYVRTKKRSRPRFNFDRRQEVVTRRIGLADNNPESLKNIAQSLKRGLGTIRSNYQDTLWEFRNSGHLQKLYGL